MDLLKDYGPDGVIGLLGGILFASWVQPATQPGYLVLVVLATAVIALVVRLVRRLTGW